MKNVTITVDEAVLEWARVEAARRGSSVSRMVGEMLAEKMPEFRRGQACDFVRYARGLLGPLGLSGAPADLFVAHVARECGFGQSVYDYNFGNVRAFASTAQPWYRNPHNGLPYRAYPSAHDGMAKMVAVVARSSNAVRQRAWAKLLAGDRTWYGDLGLSGYYETRDASGRWVPVTPATVGEHQADYDQTLATVTRCA